MTEPFPTVSILIPSLDGDQTDLHRIRDAALESGLPLDRMEILAAIGVSPNGRARDVAAIHTQGKYLISIDADVTIPNPKDLRTLVEFMEEHESVGLAGPSQQLPPDLSESARRRALQMPRSHVKTVDNFTESDMVTHACLIIERELFFKVGMEHPNLISGTDPDLRHRVRERGLKVGIVPNTRAYHPPITSFAEIIQKSFRGGRCSRWVKSHYPRYHLSAEPDMTRAEDSEKQDLVDRMMRHFRRFIIRLTHMRFWALSSQCSYSLGYLWEVFFPANRVQKIPYPEPPSPENPDWENFLTALKAEGEVRWLHRSFSRTTSPVQDKAEA